MVDVAVVNRILNAIDEHLQQLKSKKDISFEKYRKDKDIQAIVERRLENVIQACIDIGNHIVSQEGLGSPSDYGEIFQLLEQRGALSPDMANTLVKMAGFRNVLIHEYRDIIIEKVYDILQHRLPDFYTFAQAIIKYIEKAE